MIKSNTLSFYEGKFVQIQTTNGRVEGKVLNVDAFGNIDMKVEDKEGNNLKVTVLRPFIVLIQTVIPM